MCSSDTKWAVLAQGSLRCEAQQHAVRLCGRHLAQPQLSWLGTQSWATTCPGPAWSAALPAQTRRCPFTLTRPWHASVQRALHTWQPAHLWFSSGTCSVTAAVSFGRCKENIFVTLENSQYSHSIWLVNSILLQWHLWTEKHQGA